MSTYPLPTLAAQITPAGISAPAFEDILQSEIATEKSIFGDDIVLTPDQQDYQRLAVRCTALNDLNQLAIAVYNSFLPSFAQGTGLSAIVQINGLTRKMPTNSTCQVTLSGTVGTIIQGGICRDRNGNLWDLPEAVTIPNSGQITVTATAQVAGAISALPGDINQPWTIISGWQAVTNPTAATMGQPVETDAALRKRQSESVSLDADTPLSSIMSAIENLSGVGRAKGYENDTNATDANGIPSHSIAVVVEGGDATAVAQMIQLKKAPGTGTYGTTTIVVLDQKNLPIAIQFFPLEEVTISVNITIQALQGYLTPTGTAVINAIVDFINSLDVGQELYYNWLLGVAALASEPSGKTFRVSSLTISAGGPFTSADIPIQFNAAAQCTAVNVTLTVV